MADYMPMMTCPDGCNCEVCQEKRATPQLAARVKELEAALTRIVDLEQIDDRGYPTANLADAVAIARDALRAKETVE